MEIRSGGRADSWQMVRKAGVVVAEVNGDLRAKRKGSNSEAVWQGRMKSNDSSMVLKRR